MKNRFHHGCGEQAEFGGHQYATWQCPDCGADLCWGCAVHCTNDGTGDGTVECHHCGATGYYENGAPVYSDRHNAPARGQKRARRIIMNYRQKITEAKVEHIMAHISRQQCDDYPVEDHLTDRQMANIEQAVSLAVWEMMEG